MDFFALICLTNQHFCDNVIIPKDDLPGGLPYRVITLQRNTGAVESRAFDGFHGHKMFGEVLEKDGTKTWAQVFNTLWANADKTKMTDNAYINIDGDIYRVFYFIKIFFNKDKNKFK